MGYQLGIDIGGTFTDLFVFEEQTGEIFQAKVSTTPDDFSRGFVNAIEEAFEEFGVDPGEVTHLSHGTTVATNAILEREGVTTGLIATEGFRDLTAIGREDRSNIYDLSPAKTPTFTERRNRVTVSERMGADGEPTRPLDEDDVHRAVETLQSNGVESVAVSFLNAYQNGEHERRVKKLLREETDLSVSISSDVMPEIREFERTLSTVLNAYIGPLVTDYVESLETRLEDRGLTSTLHIMQASGGVITPEHVESRSLRLINSGPAAGVIGAKRFAQAAGEDDIITLDMGGTSADACVVRNGEMETTTEGELNQIPLLFPQVDVRSVGAGGGSVAWLDPANVLKVGPKSTGADPGPACYGRGGTKPTVTDAALVLGYLNPNYFLGGEMSLDVDAAEAALEPLSRELGQDVIDTANGILEIAATNMTQAIRLVTVEKGYDPRDFSLSCFGGAGPLFAARLPSQLDIGRTLIPPAPGVLSASGLLTADKKFNFSRSRILPFTAERTADMADIFERLSTTADDVRGPSFTTRRSVDLRYSGQTSQLTIDLPDGDIDATAIERARSRFHDQYEEIYGHSHVEDDVEAVTWRLQVVEETEELKHSAMSEGTNVEDAVKGSREVYAGDEFTDYTVYDRYSLPADATFNGPAIVEEAESTTVVDAGSTVRVDGVGNLVVDN